MMYKKFFVTVLVFVCCLTAFGQVKPRLGILPITGGTIGNTEIITTLFSFQSDILEVFDVVPVTNAATLVMEQNFQLLENFDADVIARIGSMLGADYVISGFVRNLEDRNLIIIAIFNVETRELLGGDYREYRGREPIPSLLDAMANNMIHAALRDTSDLPRLAVMPVYISGDEADEQTAGSLAQILVVEAANSGKFAVLPRITTIQEIMMRPEYQTQGISILRPELNVNHLLVTEVQNLEYTNLLAASIINIDNRNSLARGYRNYRTMNDGIASITELAHILTADPSAASAPESITEPVSTQQSSDGPVKNPRLWTLGFSMGSSFTTPLVIFSVHGTIAPFRHQFLELGVDLGLMSRSSAGLTFNYSLYPFAHYAFFMPFNKGGWYIGAGASLLMPSAKFPEGNILKDYLSADAIVGINLLDTVDISYTFKTDLRFSKFSHRVSVGYVYRF